MGEFLINFLKFILALILLPIVIASGLSFDNHLSSYPLSYEDFFKWGFGAFLIVFIFLHQFQGVYAFGQKVTSAMFRFLSPLERYFAYIIPFYLLIVLLAMYIVKLILKTDSYDEYFIFFAGFTAALHVFLTAQDLQEQEKMPIKPTYLLTMGFVFILNVMMVVLLLDLNTGDWTFPAYFHELYAQSKEIYISVFKRIAFFE